MSISFPKGHYIFYLAPQAEERTEDNILNVNFFFGKENNPSYPNVLVKKANWQALHMTLHSFCPPSLINLFQQK